MSEHRAPSSRVGPLSGPTPTTECRASGYLFGLDCFSVFKANKPKFSFDFGFEWDERFYEFAGSGREFGRQRFAFGRIDDFRRQFAGESEHGNPTFDFEFDAFDLVDASREFCSPRQFLGRHRNWYALWRGTSEADPFHFVLAGGNFVPDILGVEDLAFDHDRQGGNSERQLANRLNRHLGGSDRDFFPFPFPADFF